MREVNCAFCDKLFTTKRSDAKCCGKWCSSRFSQTKKNYYKINKKRKEKEMTYNNDKEKELRIYLEIKGYVLKLKNRNFMCDDIDVLRLVHFYDIINYSSWDIPKLNVDDINQVELIMGKMFTKIAEWYKENKLIYEGDNII
jgi:hypothetical protein